MKILRVGERVAYNAKFIRSIFAHELASLRGIVESVYSSNGLIVASVIFNDGNTRKVLAANLIRVDELHNELN